MKQDYDAEVKIKQSERICRAVSIMAVVTRRIKVLAKFKNSKLNSRLMDVPK